jgi:CRP-like cAMP-binding protein
MEKLKDKDRLNKYVKQYSMAELFTYDMTGYMELLFYRKNEYIIKDSEKIKYLIFLVEGKAKIFTSLSNGKSLLLCFYQDFRVLGELELIGSQNAVTNIQVIEDTCCIGMEMSKVKALLLNDAKFLTFVCSSLGNKLYRCTKNSSINILYSLENRLSSYIYTTGERRKLPGKNETRLQFQENLTETAEVLGTSYRHLLRTLNGLCGKGVLKKSEDHYEVADEAMLRRLSAELYRD